MRVKNDYARVEAEIAMTSFMQEYSDGKDRAFFYNLCTTYDGKEAIGVVLTPHGDKRIFLDINPGDTLENSYMMYGCNDPIPIGALPLEVREYIRSML